MNTSPHTPRRLRFNTVLVKIAALFILAGLSVAALMAWNNIRTSTNLIHDQIADAAIETNDLLAAATSESIQLRATGRIEGVFEPFIASGHGAAVYAVAYSSDVQPLIEGGTAPEHAPALADLASRAMAEGSRITSADGMHVATPVINSFTGQPAGAVATAWSDAEALAQQARATVINFALAGCVVLFALVTTMIAVRIWIAAPITRLSRTVDTLAAQDYEVDIPTAGRGDELGDIGVAISRLRDQLRDASDRARENRFRGTAFEASSAAVMMVDPDMRITSVNATVLDLLKTHEHEFLKSTPGFDPTRVVGHDMDFFHSGALKHRVRKLLMDPANLPYRAEIGVGEARFRLTISRVETETGALDGFVVEWDDVTDEFMNKAILASIEGNQIQAEFRVDGTLLSGNALMSQAIGRDVADFAGDPSDRIFEFDTSLAESNGTVFDQINAGNAVYGRFRLKRADGGIVIVDGGFAPVHDARGKLLRVVLIGQDITEAQTRIEAAEAERQKHQADQASVVEMLRVALEQLAGGDLTARIDATFSEDYERLRVDFNQAAMRLQAAMKGVIENAQLIRGEAAEISNAADDLSSRTERQAATLEQTASALDQLTASVKSSADGATTANALVDSARSEAEASGKVVHEAVGAMGEIENSSQEISKITGVIDDIAFQTNLLALNAGVEAARAGEAGRGFAVVASEVRALAQRSSEAAREINALISASGGQVKRGVDLVGQAGQALEGIVGSVKEISRNVAEIALSAQEQSAGLAEINSGMNQLDQVTQQNAAMFEETTAASHALTREAQTLTETMARFRTDQPAEPDDTVVTPSFSSRRKPAQTAPRPAARTGTDDVPQASPTLSGADDGWDEF